MGTSQEFFQNFKLTKVYTKGKIMIGDYMKTNYNLIMEDIIKNLQGKPKLLLHACCGVCSSSVIERLYPFFDITIL